MSESSCIFCKILAGEIPASFVYRDDEVAAIDDVNPQAPRHVLVMPIAHVPTLAEFADTAAPNVVAKLLRLAGSIGREAAGGSRTVINTGEDGGQTVDHLHLHVLAGRPMHWPPG